MHTNKRKKEDAKTRVLPVLFYQVLCCAQGFPPDVLSNKGTSDSEDYPQQQLSLPYLNRHQQQAGTSGVGTPTLTHALSDYSATSSLAAILEALDNLNSTLVQLKPLRPSKLQSAIGHQNATRGRLLSRQKSSSQPSDLLPPRCSARTQQSSQPSSGPSLPRRQAKQEALPEYTPADPNVPPEGTSQQQEPGQCTHDKVKRGASGAGGNKKLAGRASGPDGLRVNVSGSSELSFYQLTHSFEEMMLQQAKHQASGLTRNLQEIQKADDGREIGHAAPSELTTQFLSLTCTESRCVGSLFGCNGDCEFGKVQQARAASKASARASSKGPSKGSHTHSGSGTKGASSRESQKGSEQAQSVKRRSLDSQQKQATIKAASAAQAALGWRKAPGSHRDSVTPRAPGALQPPKGNQEPAKVKGKAGAAEKERGKGHKGGGEKKAGKDKAKGGKGSEGGNSKLVQGGRRIVNVFRQVRAAQAELAGSLEAAPSPSKRQAYSVFREDEGRAQGGASDKGKQVVGVDHGKDKGFTQRNQSGCEGPSLLRPGTSLLSQFELFDNHLFDMPNCSTSTLQRGGSMPIAKQKPLLNSSHSGLAAAGKLPHARSNSLPSSSHRSSNVSESFYSVNNDDAGDHIHAGEEDHLPPAVSPPPPEVLPTHADAHPSVVQGTAKTDLPTPLLCPASPQPDALPPTLVVPPAPTSRLSVEQYPKNPRSELLSSSNLTCTAPHMRDGLPHILKLLQSTMSSIQWWRAANGLITSDPSGAGTSGIRPENHPPREDMETTCQSKVGTPCAHTMSPEPASQVLHPGSSLATKALPDEGCVQPFVVDLKDRRQRAMLLEVEELLQVLKTQRAALLTQHGGVAQADEGGASRADLLNLHEQVAAADQAVDELLQNQFCFEEMYPLEGNSDWEPNSMLLDWVVNLRPGVGGENGTQSDLRG